MDFVGCCKQHDQICLTNHENSECITAANHIWLYYVHFQQFEMAVRLSASLLCITEWVLHEKIAL